MACPQDTTTDEVGAISPEQCQNPCLVDSRIELCPANAYCVFKASTQSYACECKPKYRKNPQTNECVYVCDDYCLNGGRCEVSLDTNKARCECPANYYGERCDRKSDFIYIAGGIGAAVIFIIFMVLLIWMICVRTATPRMSSSSKKMPQIPMDFSAAPSIIGGPPNFYYGPGGGPVGYAESIAPSHHSTYAHYYDDDDDGWEMPNFYNETYMKETLHAAVNGNGTTKNGAAPGNQLHGISNPSMYGNKEDLYDRLRRHQYTGKKGGK